MATLAASLHPATMPCSDPLFAELCGVMHRYLDADCVEEVARAFEFAARAHAGQHRKSGEPYISHPVAVAKILAEMHLDHQSIVAALLHDTVEDTEATKEEVAERFGEDVAELVDGVTKLGQMKFRSRAEAQAASFRKMMMAMVADIRVILIKLADRLHNMRTLDAMRPDKRRRIARETLEIYSPIANRLGLNTIRHEFEDLGFRAMYPRRYRVLKSAVEKARGNRKEVIQKIEDSFVQRFAAEGIEADIHGREKRLFSLYRKMRDKGLAFEDVFDVFAIRILVDSVDNCYRALGAVHNLYKPLPGRFKDYIAIPKANGYQSLHTVLFGPHRLPIEVQIRTHEMHQFAESGIAAHWLYKQTDATGHVMPGAQARTRDWLKDLLEMQQQAGDSLEFLENVKVDLFPDEVYVFTPKGEITELPRNATPIDFAYSVHTDIGDTCVACKIDRRLAPLNTPLQSGQTVEVITAPDARPSPSWLNFAVTAKARAGIRHTLKSLQRDEAVQLGRRFLDRALARFEMHVDALPDETVGQLLEAFEYASLEDLLADIGLGKRMAPLVARQIIPEESDTRPASVEASETPLPIRGTEGMVVSLAKCCHPIPGDSIKGYLSAGRGIIIHRQACHNAQRQYAEHPDHWINVDWSGDTDAEYPAEILVHATNRRGGLATIAATIADTGADIDNVHFDDSDHNLTAITFVINVRDRQHLARSLRRIRNTGGVVKVRRTHG